MIEDFASAISVSIESLAIDSSELILLCAASVLSMIEDFALVNWPLKLSSFVEIADKLNSDNSGVEVNESLRRS